MKKGRALPRSQSAEHQPCSMGTAAGRKTCQKKNLPVCIVSLRKQQERNRRQKRPILFQLSILPIRSLCTGKKGKKG